VEPRAELGGRGEGCAILGAHQHNAQTNIVCGQSLSRPSEEHSEITLYCLYECYYIRGYASLRSICICTDNEHINDIKRGGCFSMEV